MEKVTIITVVYNNYEKIEKTIKNVLNQTYKDIEYVVVDGASTDGTVDVIKRYEDRLIWISEPDGGIYDAMMKGVKMATGKWILFRNCGDYFVKPTSVEEVFSQYTEDCDEDFLIADSRLFLSWGYYDCKPAILNHSFQERMPVIHPSTFIRRTTQLKFPFNLKYKNSADFCFFFDAFENGAVFRYFDIIVSLVEMESGVTANSYYRTLNENIDIMKNHGVSLSIINDVRRNCYLYRVHKIITHFFPIYKKYQIRKMLRSGWFSQDVSITLSCI